MNYNNTKITKNLYKELFSSFKKINKYKNKNIFITSNLSKLYNIDISNKKKIEIVLKALKDSIGKEFTIFFPAASLNIIGTNHIFNKKNSPTYQMGSLTEYVRKFKNFNRTDHPYWSIIGIGKNKKVLDNTSSHAFAYGSAWTKMLELNTLQINLDVKPWNAISLIHYIETLVGVPYRYNKEFSQRIKVKNKIIKKKFYLSTRFRSPKIFKKENKNINFFNILKKNNKMMFCKNSLNQKIWSFKMSDFFDVASNEFKKNIYNSIIKNFKKYPNH